MAYRLRQPSGKVSLAGVGVERMRQADSGSRGGFRSRRDPVSRAVSDREPVGAVRRPWTIKAVMVVDLAHVRAPGRNTAAPVDSYALNAPWPATNAARRIASRSGTAATCKSVLIASF